MRTQEPRRALCNAAWALALPLALMATGFAGAEQNANNKSNNEKPQASKSANTPKAAKANKSNKMDDKDLQKIQSELKDLQARVHKDRRQLFEDMQKFHAAHARLMEKAGLEDEAMPFAMFHHHPMWEFDGWRHHAMFHNGWRHRAMMREGRWFARHGQAGCEGQKSSVHQETNHTDSSAMQKKLDTLTQELQQLKTQVKNLQQNKQ